MKFTGDKRRDIFFDGEYHCQIGIELYKEMVNNVECSLRTNKFNFVALLLNISESALGDAQKLYKELEASRIHKSEAASFEYPADKQNLFFDFTEKYFTAIVFAVTAVEAFVNSLLKNKNIELSNKKRFYSIYEIERQISLKDKIMKILPASRNVEIKIEEMPFWKDFCTLLKYRNELIHPKSEKLTVVFNKDDKDEILYIKSSQIKILNEIYHASRNKDLVGSARKLMLFLAQKTDYPEATPLEFRNFEAANMWDFIREKKVDVEYF